MKQITGRVMRPCFLTEEENEAAMRTTKYWTESDFFDTYREHIVAMEMVAEAAKIFILSNYQKITDWSDLNVVIKDNKKKTEYYNYKEKGEHTGWNMKLDFVAEMIQEENERNKKKHNPVVSLTDVVLDPTDGDFSITINGKEHWWIDDQSIIIIADFIEKQLKSNSDDQL